MVAGGIFCLVMGVPCLGLGLYLSSSAGRKPKKPKPQKKGRKASPKPVQPPKPKGFLLGGGLLTVTGVGLLVAHFVG